MFEVVGILHRDPSLNNFFFYYSQDGNIVGILADWDVASSKEDLALLRDGVDKAERPEEGSDVPTLAPEGDGNPTSEDNSKVRDVTVEHRPRYRTGTGPFMALDLLATTKIVHRYRHDLESFFYILCYFCAQFRPSTPDNPKAYFAYLHGWESGNIKQVHSTKYAFLESHENAFDALFKEANEAYLPLLEQWIWPLYSEMFMHVTGFAGKLEKNYGRLEPARRRNDHKLEEQFMKKFRHTADKADALLTYEKFQSLIS